MLEVLLRVESVLGTCWLEGSDTALDGGTLVLSTVFSSLGMAGAASRCIAVLTGAACGDVVRGGSVWAGSAAVVAAAAMPWWRASSLSAFTLPDDWGGCPSALDGMENIEADECSWLRLVVWFLCAPAARAFPLPS